MAIPFIWTGHPTESQRIEWLLVSPFGQVYPAQRASPHFEYFIVGLDWPSGDYRLRAEVWQDDRVIASQETVPLVQIFNERPRRLHPPAIAYPVDVNFANQIKLLGYNLPLRSLAAGQGIPITLYWQGLRTMGTSYTVFTKLLDQEQHQWHSVERLPADGYDTIYWLEDEVVIDSFELPLSDANIPPGLYWLNVGLYEEVDQVAVSLPLVVDGQISELTSLTFGPIKIGDLAPGIVLPPNEITPTYPLSVEFGDTSILRLRGYDLTETGAGLHLRLYWESLAQTSVDWTTFVHVRNAAGETVAQSDGPLGGGQYPTSVWGIGEVVADDIVIPTAELSDDYDLVIGLYNLITGERLLLPGNIAAELFLTEHP